MGRYVVRRLLLAVPVLLGTTFIIYFFVYALSGDPIRALAGDRPLSPSVQAELRDRFNLNDPFVVQYAKYIAGLAQGDFGTTFRLQPVSDIIERALPVTVKLALVAVALEAVIGLMAGILAGVRRGSFLDNLVLVSTTLVVSVPGLRPRLPAAVHLRGAAGGGSPSAGWTSPRRGTRRCTS